MKSIPFAALYPSSTRFDEIEKIVGYAKQGNSSQLIGLPGSGKSNILNLLAYNRQVRIKHLGQSQKQFHFVLVNFSEVRNKPLIAVIKFLFISLIDSLGDRSYLQEQQVLQQVLKEYLSFHDELVLFQGLKKAVDYLCLEKQLNVVLLFDRFEEYLPMLTAEFFGNLRILRNRAKYKFSVVFSLNRPLEETTDPMILIDFYEFFVDHLVYVRLFDTEGFAFRLSYVEQTNAKELQQKQIDTILHLTAGHGKVTRLCIEYVLSQQNASIDADLFLSQKPIQGSLWELWYFLTPKEQKKLTQCINEKKQISSEELFLQQVDLVSKGEITIPLFTMFIQQYIIPSINTNDALLYHPENNTITKGENVLSERLSGSEFRLLKYLLEHPDSIIDRDTLIQAVWQESESTTGVTDQAIDQLIFRLRKKIENDPNNPQYLQTIKGRGIRLVNNPINE